MRDGLPNAQKDPIYAWVVRVPRPAGPTQQDMWAKRKVDETERRTATTTAEPGSFPLISAPHIELNCEQYPNL